jgi:nitroreductase
MLFHSKKALMEKPAPTDYPVHELIAQRWSPRAFSDRPVEMRTILALLEAARWAPSSYNEQPWRFIVATRDDEEGYDRMLDCLVEFNQSWARTAPVLMVSVASLRFERNGKENRCAVHDVGLATANLMLEATARGLFVHAMAGVDLGKLRETYDIPEEFEPVAAIAVGYAGDPSVLPEELREGESAARIRKPMTDFVFGGTWEHPAALVQR